MTLAIFIIIQLVVFHMLPISAYRHNFLHLRSRRLFGALTSVKFPKETIPKKSVLVLVARGSEEIETVTVVDTLVRGGASVVLAAVGSPTLQVRCSRGIYLAADKHISDCESADWDMVVCPGGMPGAQHLSNCVHVKAVLDAQNEAGKYIAAICATPAVVLANGGYGKDRRMTCYPAPQFIKLLGDKYVNDRVTMDGHFITSQGPGTALEFSLSLVKVLFGEDKAAKVKHEMIY